MDLHSLKVLWTNANITPLSAALIGNRIAVASGDGTLFCLSVGGTVLWKQRLNLRDGPNHGSPGVYAVGSNVLVIDQTSVRRINIQDGSQIGEKIGGLEIRGGIARNGKHIYVPSLRGELLILSSSGELERRVPMNPVPIGVSADTNSYCTITSNGKIWAPTWELRCFAEEDSREVARMEVDSDRSTTAEISQSEGIVYVQRQTGRGAYESSTGKLLWAIDEYAGGGDPLFGHFVLIRDGFDIEWRDLRTGQVLVHYKDGQGLNLGAQPVLFEGGLLAEGKIVQRPPHSVVGAIGFFSYELGTLRLLKVPKDVLSQDIAK